MKVVTLILVNLFLFANSLVCNDPSGFENFDIDSYASGVWFSTYYQASIQTPLTAPCSYITTTYNTSHINFVVTDKTNASDTIIINAKIASHGVLKWQMKSMSFKGAIVTNIDLNVRIFVILIDCH